MRVEVILALGVLALVVLLSGGAVWLANAPIKPTAQPMHVVLSDERIPR